MSNYIDGFVFPIAKVNIIPYQKIAKQVSDIWVEHGALAYYECLANDLFLEGTASFADAVKVEKDETIVFGWVVFPSKEVRDLAHQKVSSDSRLAHLIEAITNPKKVIFDPSRMVFGGFNAFISSD
jgi:uncharacterized protein YbaA (DUF1428 family)